MGSDGGGDCRTDSRQGKDAKDANRARTPPCHCLPWMILESSDGQRLRGCPGATCDVAARKTVGEGAGLGFRVGPVDSAWLGSGGNGWPARSSHGNAMAFFCKS